MLCALLLGTAWSVLLPPWMGEDEPWHLEYAHHLAAPRLPLGEDRFRDIEQLQTHPLAHMQIARRIPGASLSEIAAYQERVLQAAEEDGFRARVDFATRGAPPRDFDQVFASFSAASQPPLYYSLLGLWLWPWGELPPRVELALARAPSLLAYLAVVGCTLLLARRCLGDESAALLAAGCVALWPMHARQAAVVNNDVLAKALVGVSLLLAVEVARGASRARTIAALLLCAGVGVLVKSTAVGVLGAVFLALLWARRERASRPLVWAGAGLLLLALAAGLFALWVQHSPVLPRNLDNLVLRVQRGASAANLRELWRTALGASNWTSRALPTSAYSVGLGALALPLLASLFAPWRLRAALARRAWVLCALALAAQIGLVVLRGQAAARYVFPALPALAVLWVAGVWVLLPTRWRDAAARGLLGVGFVAHVGVLLGFFLRHQYLVWGD